MIMDDDDGGSDDEVCRRDWNDVDGVWEKQTRVQTTCRCRDALVLMLLVVKSRVFYFSRLGQRNIWRDDMGLARERFQRTVISCSPRLFL